MRLVFAALAAALLHAQQPCAPTPLFQPCEIVVDMPQSAAAAHPDPYTSAQLHAEFRSPEHKTYLVPGFWDGAQRFVIRFSPDEAGEWTFRLTANFGAFTGHTGTFTATASDDPGFIRPANLHHWRYTKSLKAHLWMGETRYDFTSLPASEFNAFVDDCAARKINHVRGLLTPRASPDLAYLGEAERRIRALNAKGIFADLVLGGADGELSKLLPAWQQRERYLRYTIARFSAFHVTWELVRAFETYPDGRALLKEMGQFLKKTDPYGHPRSAHALQTSAPLLPDGWMTHILYHSTDPQLGAIEHQMYTVPAVNTGIAAADPRELRRKLWLATMNGQYPAGNGAAAMPVWWDVMSRTRWWDLEPYFDLDGGRALALPGIEYLVYVDKPGPVELTTEKESYNVYWINPATGQSIKEKKEYKGETFTANPPDSSSDWLLHLSRDGKKEGMLRSYRFEARAVPVQEIEISPLKVPFELAAPALDAELPVGAPVPFQIKLKRETRATRSMQYLITAEVARDGHGYRVLATGAEGKFEIPAAIVAALPATLTLRVSALNAPGKAYATDHIFTLKQ